jgi:hypothetical protein
MSTKKHSALIQGDGIHSVDAAIVSNSGSFASFTAFPNNSNFSSTDVGKIVLDQATGDRYTCLNVTSPTAAIFEKKLRIKDVLTVEQLELNAKKIGAGNGGDDSSMLQAAINELSTNGGGTLFFPSGVYNVGTSLSLPISVNLRGTGYNSIIFYTGASHAIIWGADPTSYLPYLRSEISDLQISSNNANSQSAIRTLNAWNGAIRNVYIDGAGHTCFSVAGILVDTIISTGPNNTAHMSIMNCFIYQTSGNGVLIRNNCNGLSVDNTAIENCLLWGIRSQTNNVAFPNLVHITRCTIEGCSLGSITGCFMSSVIERNYFESSISSTDDLIALRTPDDIRGLTFTGNIIDENRVKNYIMGIVYDNPNKAFAITVSGNYFVGQPGTNFAIYAKNVNGLQVKNNALHSNVSNISNIDVGVTGLVSEGTDIGRTTFKGLWIPGAVTSGSFASTLITNPTPNIGPYLGDTVRAALSTALPAGCQLDCSVEADSEVRVTLFNFSSVNQTFAALRVAVDCIRHELGFSIPQAGTWSTGGYWDADTGIGGSSYSVTSMASREGTSVVTTSGGTFQIVNDPLTNTNVLVGDGAAVMSETNSIKWGAYGGTHTPFIQFIQMSLITSIDEIFSIKNASASSRTQVVYTGSTTFACYRYDGTQLSLVQSVVTPLTRVTMVFVLHTDGKLYAIDSSGTSVPTSDTTGALAVDRVLIAGHSKFRRWGIKLPATGNPLLEAQELYSLLASLA